MNDYFISCCTFGWWSCLSQAGSGALTDVWESTGALGCFSITPSPLLIMATLSRPGQQHSLCTVEGQAACPPAALQSPSPQHPSPAIALFPGLQQQEEEQQLRILLYLSKGWMSKWQQDEEGGWDYHRPPPPSSQQRLCPISGTGLFPAHPHVCSAFQPGVELCCVLWVHFSLLADLSDVPWPPTGRGSAGDPHPRVPALLQAHIPEPTGGWWAAAPPLWGNFHPSYSRKLPLICFLLRSNLQSLTGK